MVDTLTTEELFGLYADKLTLGFNPFCKFIEPNYDYYILVASMFCPLV